ncbi:bifunctional serine/threonine-protein kinase/ABC transporter substrate-binding protein [Streptomyces marincola]|uniref:bifunctional serine/threonine-protein kinase/ABC transporter substrate-binding protein n=1 Tax=Streptomyces marincola TaxID=2878388 RepID=UPI001CF33D7B|nr:bifunctional serine/threonine-protein kinase/ABC transporter substrate-binding protein [Streptomyces marincola]UCM86640.1 bifunctional serine/threonine-protein kinase/ABC transporter substrate-binding protein [Streptomyces marincola]
MQALREGDPRAIGGYRLLGRLGAGGMGVVYLARSAGGALVALKTIRPRHAADAAFRTRLRREVAALRRVSSPFAVPLLDAGPDAPVPWLATAYVPAPSLADVVHALGPLPAWTVRAVGDRLARALLAVHAAGLVHRDVKPGNVLLALDGPRLIDFGIARYAGETALTAPGSAIGSPGYLSPEQALAETDVGPPSDMFSLGCVLAFAASGRPPFGEGPAAALLYRTVHDPPDLTGVPKELTGPLGALLRKEPGARPDAAGARELLPADPRLGDGWLPEPVTRFVAERATVLLDLPEAPSPPGDATRAAAAAPTAAGGGPPGGARRGGPGQSRRRVLAALSGGALTAAAGGAVLWTRRERPGQAAGGTRTVALHADLSGDLAALGRAQRRGAELAVEHFNTAADRPFEVRLRVLDDGGDAARAGEVAGQLAAEPGVLAVVGPTGEDACRAAAPVYGGDSLPWLPVSATLSALTAERGDSYFPVRLDGLFLNAPLLAWVIERTGTARAAVVTDAGGGDPSWAMSQSLRRELPHSGIEAVEVRLPAAPDERAAARTAAEAVAAGVDTVLFTGPLSGPGAAALARALREAGFAGAVGAVRSDPADGFLREAGRAADGWVVSCPFLDAEAAAGTAGFARAHRERYGDGPAPYAAEAYDTVGFVARAVGELADGQVTRRNLMRRLRGTAHTGITATYRFTEDTSAYVPVEALYLYEVRDGRFAYLGPYQEVTGTAPA